MESADYEKWIHNIYLKHYKNPISNSEWNNRIQNIPKKHQLKFKDTFWDLSSSFLKDSLYWSKIWVINPQVENPHLIYKGNFIKFDPLALSQVNKSKLSVDIQDQFPGLVIPSPYSKGALTDEQIPNSLPYIPILFKVDNEIDLKQLQQIVRAEDQPIPFYLSDDSPSTAGEILGKDDYGNFFGVSGEKVVLRMNNNVSVGSYLTVFKNKGRTGGFLSSLIGQGDEHEIQVKGILKVVSYIQGTGSLYKARVISALDQMSVKDSIFKGRPFSYNFSGKKIAKGEGLIIGSPYKTRSFLTTGSIVFLNKGSEDGIYKSAVFYIRPNTEDTQFFKRPYDYEGAILGQLKVIHTAQNRSTAVILSARDKIYVGDSFSGQISSFELEKIEESETIKKGKELLLDFEEVESEGLETEQPLPSKKDQELKEIEIKDFEEAEQEELLEDPDVEEDQSLREEFEYEVEDNEIGEDFEIEDTRSAEEESLDSHTEDKNIEEHYKVDTLEQEDLSNRKEEIKKLNEGIQKRKEDLEELEEDLQEQELEFDQMESETLEEEVKQKIRENEDLEFDSDEEEGLEMEEFVEDKDGIEMEEVEEDSDFEEIDENEDEYIESTGDEDEIEREEVGEDSDFEEVPEEDTESAENEEDIEKDSDLEEVEEEEDLQEPQNELEEFEEIDTL